MTETEKRRITLLQETRKTYNEKYTPPAIHPRYQSAYKSIYKNDEFSNVDKAQGTFVARTVVAIILLCLFAIANKNGLEEAKTVTSEIKQEFHGMDLDGFVDFQIFR